MKCCTGRKKLLSLLLVHPQLVSLSLSLSARPALLNPVWLKRHSACKPSSLQTLRERSRIRVVATCHVEHRAVTTAPNVGIRNPGGSNVSHRAIITASAPNVGRNPGGSNVSHRAIITTSAHKVGRNPGGSNVSHRAIITASAPNVGRNPGGSNVSRRAPCNNNCLDLDS